MSNDEACRMMFQSVDETSGHIIVEFGGNGAPILASDFAFVVTNTVKCLNACGKAVGEKDVKWAIIEANIIGDLASFTLKGYHKKAFETKKRREPRSETP